MSDSEVARLDRLVKKSGLSRETYLRQIISGLQPRDLPSPDFRLMMRQIYHCGNALNQIARKAHALNVIDVQKYDEAYADYRRTVEKITDAVIAPERIKKAEASR
ncbi:MAG: plasmid mobilization relaxosome protein MobC [Lachnospiraceae bacterium]|nr:plasmid mobilization relaxosome protein MobC [Lachnospiraceae bacterium]